MGLTVNLYYTGKNGSARAFAKEMTESGIGMRTEGKSWKSEF